MGRSSDTHRPAGGDSIAFDPTTGTYRTRVDDADEIDSITTTLVMAVSEATDRDPADLDPLTDAIDPDALEQLVTPRPDGSPGMEGHVTFDFAGLRITVYSGGTIDLRPTTTTAVLGR